MDLVLALTPLLTGCGAVLFCSARASIWRLPAALLGACVALGLGAAINLATHVGGWPDMAGLAAGFDALEALLALIALGRLSATRWSAQFAIVPLLVLLEGVVLMPVEHSRPHDRWPRSCSPSPQSPCSSHLRKSPASTFVPRSPTPRTRIKATCTAPDGTLTRMAASMYIVVEGEDPGFNIFVNGRALARYEGAVERLALELGVRPLLEFFSADESSMALLIEEGAGNPELLKKLPPPQWYRAEDGLRTVEALVESLTNDPQQLGSEGHEVLAELLEYEVVLRKTAERGLRWHLCVSWR